MKNLKYSIKALYMVIKKYPIYLITEIISLLSLLASTIIPVKIVEYVVKAFTDELDFKLVVNKIIIYSICLIILSFVDVVLEYVFSYVQRNFGCYVSTLLFKKLDDVDYAFHENTTFLDNYTRALEQGAENILNTAIYQVRLIKTMIQSISLFAVIFIINKLAVIYSFVIGIIFLFIKLKTANIEYQMRSDMRILYRRRNHILRIFYVKDSIADIKTTNISSCLLDNYDKTSNDLIKTHHKYSLKKTPLQVISSLLVNSIYPVILGFVCYVSIKTLNVSDVASLTVAASMLSSLVSTFVTSVAYIQNYAIECNVPFEFLKMHGTIEESTPNDDCPNFNEICIKNAFFKYTDSFVLKGINLRIKKGEKIAIVGTNGAGKSTLLKLLLRLYDLNEGIITYNGDDYKKINPKAIRKKIGAVFQDSLVYSVSVAENILLRKVETEEDQKIVIDALKFSGLYEKVKTLENGIATVVTREFHKEGAVFSGGEKQKLAISRGYAQGYELFILDEPSSSLDPIAEAKMYQNMLQLGKDKTLLFISHRLSATRNADYIYLLDDGLIKEEGSHEKLMAQKGLYYNMFISQSEKYIEGDDNV